MPLALCSACFSSDCYDSSCLPTLNNTPSNQRSDNTNDAAWTGFTGGSSASDILSYFPSGCSKKGGAPIPTLTAGTDTINLNNGQVTQQVLQAIQCLVCPPISTPSFLVAVFSCDTCGGPLNQSAQVVGFATISVISFNFANGQPPQLCGGESGALQSMNVQAVFNTTVTGPPGGGNFGTLSVYLVG